MFLKPQYQVQLVTGILLSLSSLAYAQDSLTVVKPRKVSYAPRHYMHTCKAQLHQYTVKMDSLIGSYKDWQYPDKDVLSNPYYFALMGGSTLYSTAVHNKIGSLSSGNSLLQTDMALSSSQHIHRIVDETDLYLIQTYSETPWYVRFKEEKEGTMNVDQKIEESYKPETTLTERFSDLYQPDTLDVFTGDDMDIVVRKPNFWTFKTNFSFQFTQNYVSDNWYKGGESHNALLAATSIQANFDNKRRLTFDNHLEMKLGFQTSHDDSKHKFKTNSDLLRLTNKLGYCAVHDWYYTLMLQSWTQFYKGYKPNDPRVYSDFMAPFVSLLSLGMDYKKTTKNNRFTVTATVSPIALKFQFVKFSDLVTSFGHDPGKKVKWEYGSNITVNYTWNIWKNISWAGRFYFFSDYSKVQMEWENTFNFTINRYLSTRLFLYPRFDDAVVRKDGMSYFQFNELLSLGLNCNF